MRKVTKLAILVAALVALCSIAALAADTWKQEGDQWFCYDSDGNPYYGVWKKSGANQYYLDDATGAMVTNTLVETEGKKYWCGEDGAKVMNKWVQVPVENNDDGWEWMYFKAVSGQAQVGDGLELLVSDTESASYGQANPEKTFATIKNAEGVSRKYLFDTDGYMKYGYVKGVGDAADNGVLDAEYYFGTKDEGWQFTGWQKFVDGALGDYDSDYANSSLLYAYFKNGKKITAWDCNDDGQYKVATGKLYAFQEDGILITGYVETEDGWVYLGAADDGLQKKKLWVKTAAMNPEEDNDETEYWFYLDSDGYPTVAAEGTVAQIKKVNGKYYFFSELGKMMTGVYQITVKDELVPDDEEQTYEGGFKYKTVSALTDETNKIDYANGERIYYFSTDADNDGSMKIGTQTVTIDGEEVTMYFYKYGCAYEGIVSNKIYNNGVLKSAGDSRFAKVKLWNHKTDDDAKYTKDYYLVNAGGSIQCNTKVVDADGIWWVVDDEYNIYKICGKDYAAKAAAAIKNGLEGFTVNKVYYELVKTEKADEGYTYVDYKKVTVTE